MSAQIAPEFPTGVTVFATGYDPLDLASDSIDPLGFLKVYLALADRMLPGFTTVTTVPRYLPMLCAGLLVAERLHPRDEGDGLAKSRARRLEVLRNFEKVWALACGLAQEPCGEPATEGLRGIRYVRRYLESNAARAEINPCDYDLLQNQVRYGGIGTYGQMLEACHFVDWDTLTLRPLGEKLAEVFPQPPGWVPERPRRPFDKAALVEWGEEVCLDKITEREAKRIREGLKGGLEAERDDDVRWNCLRLLKSAGAGEAIREEECLHRLRRLVNEADDGDARKAEALRQLRVVIPLIEPLEQLYQSVLFIFDEIRASATDNPVGCALTALDQAAEATKALEIAQNSHRTLAERLASVEKVDPAVCAAIVSAMRDSGITALAESVASVSTIAEAGRVLIQRHAAVQSGKFDRGQPKAPWMRLEDGKARLTSQRNELTRAQHAKSWHNIVRHPYRTGAAGRFIRQCRIS